MTEKTKEPVGVLIRVSTAEQAKSDSPTHHLMRAQAYADATDRDIIEIYQLKGVSGKAVDTHPEMQRMLSDIRRGHIKGLIFSKLPRLARSQRILLEIAQVFRDHNAALIGLDLALDTSTPAGRMFFGIMASYAEYEWEEISSRVSASVRIRAEAGKPMGGKAPFGYQWVDKQFTIHLGEAPIRAYIYHLFLKHQRLQTVADILNKENLKPRSSDYFRDSTVSALISDPTAKGVRRCNYTKTVLVDGKRRPALKPESEWIYHPCPAIVPVELWEECNRILKENEGKAAKLTVHPFSGLLTCTCKGKPKLYPDSNHRWRRYRCRNCKRSISADLLDQCIHQELTAFFSTDLARKSLNSHTKTGLQIKQEILGNKQKELTRIDQGKKKLFDEFIAGHLKQGRFGELDAQLTVQGAQLEREIAELQGEIDYLTVQLKSAPQTSAEAEQILLLWNDFTPSEKRDLLREIIDAIEVGKSRLTVQLAYFPQSFKPWENIKFSENRVGYSDKIKRGEPIRAVLTSDWTA